MSNITSKTHVWLSIFIPLQMTLNIDYRLINIYRHIKRYSVCYLTINILVSSAKFML